MARCYLTGVGISLEDAFVLDADYRPFRMRW